MKVDEKILLVDDEASIVRSFQRHLDGEYEIEVALSGENGLQQLASQGPFAVVVSDLQMPRMNGIEFLSKVRERYPDTIRIVLTGNAQINSAIELVNKGSIFRFLTKPISTDDFEHTLAAALRQHRLERSEKDLLRKTLMGIVEVLTEIITLLDPIGFATVPEKRSMIQKLVKSLEVTNSLDLELAAVLSTLGAAVVPTPVLVKLRTAQALEPHERKIIDTIPQLSAGLLEKIPRLEGVATLLRLQGGVLTKHEGEVDLAALKATESQQYCAQILYIVDRFIDLQTRGFEPKDAITHLKSDSNSEYLSILNAISELFDIESAPTPTAVSPKETVKKTAEVSIAELSTQHILLKDVCTRDKLLLASAGTSITETLLQRLQNYSQTVGIQEPIVVTWK